MLGIYRLLFFVVLSVRRILVTDISGVDARRVVKFCRVADLGVHQVISPFGELWPRLAPLSQKVKNCGNGYLIDRLRYGAEILQDGRSRSPSGHLPFW